ncbi:MAG: DUF3857 domain-containing protein [Cyclobacteriaceae bacterium]|nr:DUF3857 domain-containing protein [Cyclobacteriaceae bacterium]
MRHSLVVWCLLGLLGFAQANPFVPYEWQANRPRYALTEEEKSKPEIILLNHVEFNYGFENDQFMLQSVFHRIVYVNGAQAIQNNNTIAIPMYNVIELMDMRARAISRDGKVTLFDKNNLKEVKNEERGDAYRLFAIEGIEPGSEVEYYFVRKMYPRLYDRAMIQTEVPIRSASFILRTPKHLVFDVRSYNGFVRPDTSSTTEHQVYKASMADIPALKKEPFSFYEPNRMRVEFKLAYNTARNRSRLNTWDDAAKSFFKTLNQRDKDEEKALARYVETLSPGTGADLSARIRQIEDKIKTTITLNNESSDEGLSNLAQIIKSKVASNQGSMRLFVGVFAALGITAEPVITCSREKVRFDGNFDTWGYLDEYFLYFPDTRGFLAPHDRTTRYPLIPLEYTNQKGLFIETLDLGGMKSGLASIKEIPAPPHTLSMDNMEISAGFDATMDSAVVRVKRTFMGYNGDFVTPYYHLMTKEEVHRMVETITRQTAPDAAIKKWSAAPLVNQASAAFEIDVTFHSAHLYQRAGGNYLFRIGELIGPQTELYADKERMNDIENTHNRGYDRKITFEIPSGYRIRNLDDLKFNVVFRENNDEPFLFRSDYTLQGNRLVISIDEFYKKVSAPKAQYEEFRKVINAAADFNKVTLILEKVK